MHTQIHAYAYTHARIHIHTHMLTYTYVHTCSHTHMYTHVHIHICTHMFTYTYVHTCSHTRTYTHARIHTHTHISIGVCPSIWEGDQQNAIHLQVPVSPPYHLPTIRHITATATYIHTYLISTDHYNKTGHVLVWISQVTSHFQ